MALRTPPATMYAEGPWLQLAWFPVFSYSWRSFTYTAVVLVLHQNAFHESEIAFKWWQSRGVSLHVADYLSEKRLAQRHLSRDTLPNSLFFTIMKWLSKVKDQSSSKADSFQGTHSKLERAAFSKTEPLKGEWLSDPMKETPCSWKARSEQYHTNLWQVPQVRSVIPLLCSRKGHWSNSMPEKSCLRWYLIRRPIMKPSQ